MRKQPWTQTPSFALLEKVKGLTAVFPLLGSTGPREAISPSPSREVASLDMAGCGLRRNRNHRVLEYAVSW
jgi:hypothetical protein